MTLAGRKAHEDEWERCIAEWTRSRSAEDAAAALQARGVPAYPVRDGRTLVDRDAALRAWEFYQTVTHPVAGAFPHEGLAARLEGTPGAVRAPAPLLGQHTAEILTGLLGLTAAELDALRDAKILE
jgi:crotonobetainyl-CoA:carnitine CoA-transferase CaiB-like acyl-CoA transferase